MFEIVLASPRNGLTVGYPGKGRFNVDRESDTLLKFITIIWADLDEDGF